MATHCLDAQTVSESYGNGPINSDIGGPCVAIANIVINSILPFLVILAPDVGHVATVASNKDDDDEAIELSARDGEPSRNEASSSNLRPSSKVASGEDNGDEVIETSRNEASSSIVPSKVAPIRDARLSSALRPEDSSIVVPSREVPTSIVVSSIFLLYSQTIPVLLATLISMNGQSLSLYDSHFAFAVTTSPTSLYVSGCCLLYLFPGRRSTISLFKKIPSKPEIIVITVGLGLALPPLWISVSVVTSFSSGFRNSGQCVGMSVSRYVAFLVMSTLTGDVLGYRDVTDDLFKRQGLGLITSFLLWTLSLLLVRNREQIIDKWRKLNTGSTNSIGPKQYLVLAWHIPRACWEIMVKKHSSVIILLLCCLHYSWILGVVKAITFSKDQLSYGQLLSLVAPIPALYSLYRAFRHDDNWKKVGTFFSKTNLKEFFSGGLCFIITGEEKWSDGQRPRGYLDFFTGRWGIPTIIVWLASLSGYGIWIWFWVKAATLPNEPNRLARPHRVWKPVSVLLFVTGIFVCILNMFFCVAGLDYYHKTLPHQNTSPDLVERPRPRWHWRNILHGSVGLTICVLCFFFLSASPLFALFAAMPLSQREVWLNGCTSYPTEITLEGQANSTLTSTISFYTTLTLHGQSQRQHIYDYVFFNISKHKVLQYRPVNTTRPQDEPTIKTLFLNPSEGKFFGCSIIFPENILHDNGTQPEGMCYDAVQATYTQNPYLSFDITTPGKRMMARLENPEFVFKEDAPFFSLRRVANVTDGSFTETIILRSAVTKLGSNNVLKVCSNEVASAEVLGPLTLFMIYLNNYAAYIDRAKVYPVYE